jgi:hypothetical protein
MADKEADTGDLGPHAVRRSPGRQYRAEDERARLLRDVADRVGGHPRHDTAQDERAALTAAERLAGPLVDALLQARTDLREAHRDVVRLREELGYYQRAAQLDDVVLVLREGAEARELARTLLRHLMEDVPVRDGEPAMAKSARLRELVAGLPDWVTM